MYLGGRRLISAVRFLSHHNLEQIKEKPENQAALLVEKNFDLGNYLIKIFGRFRS